MVEVLSPQVVVLSYQVEGLAYLEDPGLVEVLDVEVAHVVVLDLEGPDVVAHVVEALDVVAHEVVVGLDWVVLDVEAAPGCVVVHHVEEALGDVVVGHLDVEVGLLVEVLDLVEVLALVEVHVVLVEGLLVEVHLYLHIILVKSKSNKRVFQNKIRAIKNGHTRYRSEHITSTIITCIVILFEV